MAIPWVFDSLFMSSMLSLVSLVVTNAQVTPDEMRMNQDDTGAIAGGVVAALLVIVCLLLLLVVVVLIYKHHGAYSITSTVERKPPMVVMETTVTFGVAGAGDPSPVGAGDPSPVENPRNSIYIRSSVILPSKYESAEQLDT